MVKKLYRKLYFYAIIILFTSIVLTATVMAFLFQFSQRNIFRDHLLTETFFIRQELNKTYTEENEKFRARLFEISGALRWRIAYGKDNRFIFFTGRNPPAVDPEKIKILNQKKELVLFDEFKAPPEFLMLLDEKDPSKGYLNFKLGNTKSRYPRFWLLFFWVAFILLFLGVLLIPYSLYILKPFKNLMEPIGKISAGDFSAKVEVPKNSEFQELADAFNNMIFKIREMILQKQRLVADVSHELRSPLTRLRMGIEIGLTDPVGKKKYLEKAITEIENLDRLIDNLLDISKLELNREKLILNNIDFKEFINENIEKNQLLFENKELKISKTFPDMNIIINADKILLERALNNIFSNVLKYAPQKTLVDIIIKKEGNNAVLSVRDRGQGVKKEDFEKIFEPFYRTDDSRSRKTGGTGLGLPIVKSIVKLHNGRVWVDEPTDLQGGFLINIEFKTI